MELLLVVAVLLVSLLVLRQARRSIRRPLAIFVAVGCGLCAIPLFLREPPAGSAEDPAMAQIPTKSNDFGYVSSDACHTCHPSEYSSWHRSYHRTMTQVVTPETMLADWQGSLDWRGHTFFLERVGDEFWVDMVDREWSLADLGRTYHAGDDPTRRVRRRVVMSTGSHHQQVYWVASGEGRRVHMFDFTWLIHEQRWIPYERSFLRPDDPQERSLIWNTRCIKCHATMGQPRLDEDWVPDTRVGELGIACEACHGPGQEHIEANRNPVRRYRKRLGDEPDPTIVNPAKLPARRSTEVCGQCHAILETKDLASLRKWQTTGYDFRPGDSLHETRPPMMRPDNFSELEPAEQFYYECSTWPDGAVRVSGREYTGFTRSPCYQGDELSCLSCHSMHSSDPEYQVADRMDTDEACLQCHESFRDRLEEHTHHPPESTGSRCYNCHMPYTSYGLFKALRSHTIGVSPSVEESLSSRRPNACNLCHLDQTLAWTGAHLNQWYGQTVPQLSEEQETRSAALLWLLRGDAGQRALVAWSMGWEPAVEASRGRDWMTPFLIETLDDPYAAVRFIAHRSLTGMPGFADFEYDFVEGRQLRLQKRKQAWSLWQSATGPVNRGPRLFFDASGRVDAKAVQDVFSRRDHRQVDLAE